MRSHNFIRRLAAFYAIHPTLLSNLRLDIVIVDKRCQKAAEITLQLVSNSTNELDSTTSTLPLHPIHLRSPTVCCVRCVLLSMQHSCIDSYANLFLSNQIFDCAVFAAFFYAAKLQRQHRKKLQRGDTISFQRWT